MTHVGDVCKVKMLKSPASAHHVLRAFQPRSKFLALSVRCVGLLSFTTTGPGAATAALSQRASLQSEHRFPQKLIQLACGRCRVAQVLRRFLLFHSQLSISDGHTQCLKLSSAGSPRVDHGSVCTGSPIAVQARPHPCWTVAGCMIERRVLTPPPGLTVTSGGLGTVGFPPRGDRHRRLRHVASTFLAPPLAPGWAADTASRPCRCPDQPSPVPNDI